MITIEKLKIEDIEDVSFLLKELVPFDFSVENAFEKYQEIINDSNYLIIVAKENNKIVGTVSGIICKCLATSFLVIEALLLRMD